MNVNVNMSGFLLLAIPTATGFLLDGGHGALLGFIAAGSFCLFCAALIFIIDAD